MPLLEPNAIIREDLELIVGADLPWARLERKVIMVTGGGGFIGSYLVKSLIALNEKLNLGLKVICVVRSSQNILAKFEAYLARSDLSFVVHDITNPLPANFPSADFIIHSASQASPKYYGVDPIGTLMANSAGTMYLLEHAVKHLCSGFLFFSSGEVYGLPIAPESSVTESDYGYVDPIQVRSCYAESKRLGETMCAAWSHQHGIHTSVVRPFHTYGPGISLVDGRVFSDFVADVVARRDIIVKSQGLTQRPFCYISDAILGFFTVLLKGETAQAYNVANPSAEISMRDLAHTLSKICPNVILEVRFEIAESGNDYLQSPIVRSCPSIDKINKLGWMPNIDVVEGFGRTIKSFLNNS
jgi:UDP-glucuronate decarboxylase